MRTMSVLAVLFLSLMFPFASEESFAATGDQLRAFAPNPTGNGRAVAYDGANTLYYRFIGDNNIYRATTAGQSLGPIPNPGGRPFCGALSWDPLNRQLWCGAYDGTGQVHKVDPVTGVTTFAFTGPFQAGESCYAESLGDIDGLAYDASDNTLWLSDDAARKVYHVSTTGAVLGSFTTPNHPSTGSPGCNTGIAVVRGGFLELALQAGPDLGPHVVARVAKSEPTTLIDHFVAFSGDIPGVEDLEYDENTFAPLCAVWSYQFGPAQPLIAWEVPCRSRAIFTGIFGGNIFDLRDNPDREIGRWIDTEIRTFLTPQVPLCQDTYCDATNTTHLEAIAHDNDTGGITAIGFFLTHISPHISINQPGNSEVLKQDIDAHFHDGSRIYLVGHSVGAGDVQNLLEKLKVLGIPVELSGLIDSIEAGDDATIPDNTKQALGFYQTARPRGILRSRLGRCLNGENQLVPEDPSKTNVLNIEIRDPLPQGPSDPNSEGCVAYHRNMDNDDRVWKTGILARIQELEDDTFAASIEPPSDAAADLLATLLLSPDPQRKRYARRTLAAAKPESQNLEWLLAEYHSSSSEDFRIQLQSVIGQIDSSQMVARVGEHAAKTPDEALFISLVYSLRKAFSVEAGEMLLRLIENSVLPPGKSVSAIYAPLLDVVKMSGCAWIQAFVSENLLSDRQAHVIARLAKRCP